MGERGPPPWGARQQSIWSADLCCLVQQQSQIHRRSDQSDASVQNHGCPLRHYGIHHGTYSTTRTQQRSIMMMDRCGALVVRSICRVLYAAPGGLTRSSLAAGLVRSRASTTYVRVSLRKGRPV